MQIEDPSCFELVGDHRDESWVAAPCKTAEEEEGEEKVLVGVCCVRVGGYEGVGKGFAGWEVVAATDMGEGGESLRDGLEGIT